MKISSIYKTLEESAELCPSGINIKFLFRHSIRGEIGKNVAHHEIQNAQLTLEGRKFAESLGESIDMEIGKVSSSLTQRCVDTCSEIIKGYNKNHAKYAHRILETKMLQCPQVINESDPKGDETWERLGLEGIFNCYASNIEMPGMYNLQIAVEHIIKYIFDTGNIDNTIDLFCTHDFQLAMLLLYFSENKIECKDNLFNGDWPLMLEGMFLWGNVENYNILWRGKKITQ